MTNEQMLAEIEALRADNARLTEKIQAKRASAAVTFKVSEKGAVSAYGLQRFPVTLYKEQWVRLLNHAEDLRTFIAENESVLTVKAV